MIPALLILCDTAQQATTNSPSFVTTLSILGSIASIVSLILYKKGLLDNLLPYRWRKRYRESITEDLRNAYLKNKIYLQPYITTTPPQASHEPENIKLENKELLRDYFINKVFIKESGESNTVFFLFGDSGTGKTAALVHLFNDYLNKHNAFNLPFNIRLISLRREDALNDIANIPKDKREKLILLLDAMDETPEVNDPTQLYSFLNHLKEEFLDFARIVITCRPQFFPDDIRQEIITNPEGIRTSTGWIECSIKYLAPFDEQQVQDYLDQAITFRSEDPRRHKAEEIINLQPAIAIRPLVLSFIKEIVDLNRPVNTILDLFDTIIHSILKRDIKKTLRPKNLEEKIRQWWEASSLVAKYMYENQKLNITDSELDRILPNDIEKQFKQRSLLTRYGNTFHFSHKSFYEYFMAYRFLQHPKEIKQVYGMDFALQIYNDALQALFEQNETPFANLKNTHPYTVAISLNRVGYALDDINHFSDAEKYYQLALDLFRLLEKEKNDTYKDDIAMVLNNLAVLHQNTNQLDKAKEEYNEALTTYRQLADKNSDAFLPYVAGTLNNLAALHSDTNQLDKAEEEYNEALTIRRQMADKNPDAYLPDVAMTLNNLAVLHRNTNQLDKAEEEYNEALTTYRQLADKNPDAYLPDVAQTLNNLAILHRNTNQYKEAEEEYNEALTIRRQLADKNPDAFLPKVANTLNNLAVLHKDTKQYKEAEEEYNEALTTYRQLADKHPDAYLPYVAVTLFNLALLHLNRKKFSAAETAALESLEKYRIMAEKSHAAFDKDVKDTEELLEDIQKAKEADA